VNRYGSTVDLVVTVWAVAMCAFGVLTWAGIARVGFSWDALAYVGLGLMGAACDTFCSWQTIRMVRGARDGDVPERGAR
jgi:hypothetical protein